MDGTVPASPAAFLAGLPPGLAVLAYRRRRAFAWTWRPRTWLRKPDAEVVLSIALPREDASPRWKQVA